MPRPPSPTALARAALAAAATPDPSPLTALLDEAAQCPDSVTASDTLLRAIVADTKQPGVDPLLPPPGWLLPP